MPSKKKKRKPRARATAPGVTDTVRTEEKKRARLDERREERARQEARLRRRRASRRMLRTAVLVAAGLAIVWFAFLRHSTPNEIDGHPIEDYKTFTAESQAQQLHTSNDVPDYESTPPVSGMHDPNPAACGVHGEHIRDENMVHTLEHGSVGVLYRPDDVSPDDIKSLEAIVRGYDDHVFSEPYPDMETPFAMVAWAHVMRLDTYDEQAITDFIDTFRTAGDAPESADCPMDSDTSFTPSPSPVASPSKSK
ncbi:MAG TPA: DUF3105 domain-containing protein [Actinomycetota bacterium]|nr:DUF3105 domain-containing protein [Actinomycetota bacterium]